jgi:EF hand
VKTAIYTAAALLLVHCASVMADDDKERYNRRAAQTDMLLFRELDRSGNGLLTMEDTRGDMRLGTRFDDIDINRDGIITPQEMRIYIQQTYGVLPAPQ